jgi:hypothetical protein
MAVNPGESRKTQTMLKNKLNKIKWLVAYICAGRAWQTYCYICLSVSGLVKAP